MPAAGAPAPLAVGRLQALAYRTIGTVAFALAIAGVILPGLPATPFLLLAAWAFARGSPERAARLERHPRFGPILRNWRERRAVPRRAKALAIASMGLSLLILWRTGAPAFLLVGVSVVLVCVSAYLLSRPSA